MTEPGAETVDRAFIERNLAQLFDFARANVDDRGRVGWLLDDGQLDPNHTEFPTWLAARFVHVSALGQVLGAAGSDARLATGMDALDFVVRPDGLGWYSSIAQASSIGITSPVECYVQAHVGVASAAAEAAGLPGGRMTRELALGILDTLFWDERVGAYRDEFDPGLARRGQFASATANMHCLEALLATADLTTGNERARLLARALRLSGLFVDGHARNNRWRMVTGVDADGSSRLDPPSPVRGMQTGSVPGLGFEWARLLLHLRSALGTLAPTWLLPAAVALFARARADGLASDGEPGVIFSTDWTGELNESTRYHWVQAEAISAAAVLASASPESAEETHALLVESRCWAFVRERLIDPENGSWAPEASALGILTHDVWTGRPDLYHAVHACVFSLAATIGHDGGLPTPLAGARAIAAVRDRGRVLHAE